MNGPKQSWPKTWHHILWLIDTLLHATNCRQLLGSGFYLVLASLLLQENLNVIECIPVDLPLMRILTVTGTCHYLVIRPLARKHGSWAKKEELDSTSHTNWMYLWITSSIMAHVMHGLCQVTLQFIQLKCNGIFRDHEVRKGRGEGKEESTLCGSNTASVNLQSGPS